MATEEVKLLGNSLSPFVLRVIWALKIKEVDYEFIEEDTLNKSPLLLKYNPIHKKIPVLVHNCKPLAESLVILEYIDEIWKENPLLPNDPYERARARFLSKFGDENCLPSIWLAFISQGKDEEAFALATKNMTILENELNGKKFFGGETVGFVDISLGWITYMVRIIEDITQVKMIDEQKFPSLCAWIWNVSTFPAISGSLLPPDTMIAKFNAIRDGAPRGAN